MEPVDDGTVLRLEGEFWTMAYGGHVLRLRDAVGLRHLAQLLWHPYRDFHALDLMRALALAGRSRGGRYPRQEVRTLDPEATAAYGRRLRDLEDHLMDAEAGNDLGQMDAIRSEIAVLLNELRHGTRGR